MILYATPVQNKRPTWYKLVFLFIGLSMIGISAYLIIDNLIPQEEQSIDCAYAPPAVSLPQMHAEIREYILDDFGPVNGAILMNGGFVTSRYDTDVEQVFRQESNFLYVTGYDQPNGTIVIDIPTRKSILFVPFRPQSYAIWNGNIESLSQIKEKYQMDEVKLIKILPLRYYSYDLNNILNSLSSGSSGYTVYVMDSIVEFPGMANYTIDTSVLQEVVYSRREVKTDMELELIRYASAVSSGAHELVMNYTTPGLYEYNVEGRFLDGCFACGLSIQAYIPICASGNNSAILHYNANNKEMSSGEFLLIDAGAEYEGYATDITRTYPVNGLFTEDQALIYQMVLNVQLKAIALVVPGVTWNTLQTTTEQYVCEELINNGFINSTLTECATTHHLYYYFFPHGVSHYIGLDVHDRSGSGSGSLNERNVITVEPGIYFNRALLEPALVEPVIGKYFVASKIQPLLDQEIGGVRIEDVVVVWATGPEVITFPPKSIFELEFQMSQN